MNVRIPKLFLAFLALALALCACSAKEAAFQTAEEAGEAFLTEFLNLRGGQDTVIAGCLLILPGWSQ